MTLEETSFINLCVRSTFELAFKRGVLNRRYADICILRFSLPRRTQKQIAQLIGVSEQRVGKILPIALMKMVRHTRNQKGWGKAEGMKAYEWTPWHEWNRMKLSAPQTCHSPNPAPPQDGP